MPSPFLTKTKEKLKKKKKTVFSAERSTVFSSGRPVRDHAVVTTVVTVAGWIEHLCAAGWDMRGSV